MVPKKLGASYLSFMSIALFFGCDNPVSEDKTLAIHTDNSIRAYGGDVYIVERGDFSNIIKLKGTAHSIVSANISVDYSEANAAVYSIETGTVTEMNKDYLVRQDNIGTATNIHDIAFVSSTKAYITQYGASDVVIYNPSTGEKYAQTIDLGSYSATGIATPKMDAAVVYNSKVYIGLQKYDDSFGLTENSSVVYIDAAADSVGGEIILDAKNPQGMHVSEERLFVACTGVFGVQDGGVEVIDLTADSTRGILVDETALGGDVSNVIVISSSRAYAVVGGSDYKNSVVPFDPGTGQVDTKVASVGNAAIFGLAHDGTYLYVADRDMAASGILVIDPADNSLVSGPHSTGIPPNAIAFVE
ncbi:MAG: hypothetical protein GF350_12300 [Chitinivibrionales bacterium]|nr:hypothetical protein [Chitinivibrionales bacterium]